MKNIVAIVPVRKGSERVKNKNIRKFADTNLLTIKLNSLKKVQGVADIIVSSDCVEMLDIAKSHGVKTHMRENYYASSQCTNSEFFENLAKVLCDYDNVMYSPVTCPLISVSTYDTMIQDFQHCNNLVSASLVKQHLWLDGSPLNYDIKNSPNTQNLPDIMKITYGVSLIERSLMLQSKNIVSETPEFYVLDEKESVDIDTELDFKFAEYLYKEQLSICESSD